MKAQKIKFLTHAKRTGMFDLARRRTASAVRILCYHGIWLGRDAFTGDAMFMRPAAFARRMALLREWAYPVVSLDEAVEALKSGRPLPPNSVVITIDDGWYGTYRHMLPVLKQLGLPATLYCDTANLLSGDIIPHVLARYLRQIAAAEPGRFNALDKDGEVLFQRGTDISQPRRIRLEAAEKLAARLGIDLAPYRDDRAFQYMTPAELRSARDGGLAVELHTHNHSIHDMSQAAIADEIRLNREALSNILAQPPETFRHFCYPSGRASPAASGHLAGIGLASSTTTEQGLAWPGTDRHLLPRLLDNENHSEIEFEAELSGFADALRAGRRRLSAFRRRTSASSDGPRLNDAA